MQSDFGDGDESVEGYQVHATFPPVGGGEEGQASEDFQEFGTVKGVIKYVETANLSALKLSLRGLPS
jgi:hypothetical protein